MAHYTMYVGTRSAKDQVAAVYPGGMSRAIASLLQSSGGRRCRIMSTTPSTWTGSWSGGWHHPWRGSLRGTSR